MKTNTIYVCQACGYQAAKWLGRCPDCQQWNAFIEEADINPQEAAFWQAGNPLSAEPVSLSSIDVGQSLRITTGVIEFDRILGGGIVQGSVVLIGGGPGIGKSTLLLQVCNKIASENYRVLYVTAEESVKQAKLRANRLGAASQYLYIVNETNVDAIKGYVDRLKPKVLIVDSIQAVYSPQVAQAPGGVSQLRQCANFLAGMVKSSEMALFIIGHVTKEGVLAGPRLLEHLVDTVLYFESEVWTAFRILRAVKNRFGPTNEIGIFEMSASGLSCVDNPSALFLSERPKDAWGSAVTAAISGTRPLLVEIQALTSVSKFGMPSRKCTGFDYNKLSLLIAVLEKRLGYNLGGFDVFVNVVGGIQIEEPAIDLAVIAAVASSFKEKAARHDCVLIGEVGLAAEVRRASQIQARVNEAERLGFKSCILPKSNLNELNESAGRFKIQLIGTSRVDEAIKIALNI